jgi:ATP synthase protein I
MRPAVIDVKHVVPVTLLAQVCVSLIAALAFWAWMDADAGKSALLGGIAVVIPNGFLAARLLRPGRDDSVRAILRSAWIGEIGKWLLTVLLFAAIFGAVRPLEPVAFFCGFIAAQMVIFGALFLSGAQPTEAITKS